MLKLVMLAGLMLLITDRSEGDAADAARHRCRDGDATTGLFPPAQ